jgi:hypothetical protein
MGRTVDCKQLVGVQLLVEKTIEYVVYWWSFLKMGHVNSKLFSLLNTEYLPKIEHDITGLHERKISKSALEISVCCLL